MPVAGMSAPPGGDDHSNRVGIFLGSFRLPIVRIGTKVLFCL